MPREPIEFVLRPIGLVTVELLDVVAACRDAAMSPSPDQFTRALDTFMTNVLIPQHPGVAVEHLLRSGRTSDDPIWDVLQVMRGLLPPGSSDDGREVL